jgi:large subunit ribosomal protein L4
MAVTKEIKKKTANTKKDVVKSELKAPVNKTTTKAVSKPTVKVAKEATVKVPSMRTRSGLHNINTRKAAVEKGASIKVDVVGVDGKTTGKYALSEEVFGMVPNKVLIAQAVRVYLANQRQGNASTKTRSEVVGSTRKIYRQKGTGRARHGAIKAPIFVGGGIAHGPHPHDFSLKFPTKMKKAALISALSEKAQSGFISVVDGEFSGKTKEFATLLKKMDLKSTGKRTKVLFVVDKNETASRAAHNISNLEVETASTLSTYGVFLNRNIIFLKNAVEELTKRLAKN